MPQAPSAPIAHNNARDAWDHFRHHCGIEIDGRDVDLAEQVREKLQAGAPSLDAAIDGASNDQLVRAIFECVAPFASMSRDILAFFRRAGARHGPSQWALVVDEVPFHLEDFVEFQRQAAGTWGYFERPKLDRSILFELVHILHRAARGSGSRMESDAEAWSEEFFARRYSPWPTSLDPLVLPAELRELAEIGRSILEQIRAAGLEPDDVVKLRKPIFGDASILDAPDLAFAENDHWLRALITGLATLKHLFAGALQEVGEQLSAALGRLPRILAAGEIRLHDLQKILSLPVWRRRHEVYSVWIATQIVNALPSKDLVVHHENGKIKFAFRRTEVASLPRVTGDITLFSERKEPLAKPIGRGRKRAVQPDFSLWKKRQEGESCALVVEVKHYAQAATRSFSEVLVDYANAHREAEVVLVNYGPTSDMLDRVDDASEPVADRCHHIADLTPLNAAARQSLAKYVVDAVKRIDARDIRLLVDISGSMKNHWSSSSFRAWLEGPANEEVGEIILVDKSCQWSGPPSDAWDWVTRFTGWTAEDLAAVARRLLKDSDELRFVTDGGGYQGLTMASDLESWIDFDHSPAGLIMAMVRKVRR